jgi:hypothetical protein
LPGIGWFLRLKNWFSKKIKYMGPLNNHVYHKINIFSYDIHIIFNFEKIQIIITPKFTNIFMEPNSFFKFLKYLDFEFFSNVKNWWLLFLKIKELPHIIFCNLLLKIHIVAPIDHMFYDKHFWINMKISKCVNFAKFCIHLEILS